MNGYGRLWQVNERAACLFCPYAAVEIRCFLAKFSEGAIGSGPRGRWFKSTRPDQFLENPQKSAQFSRAVHSVLVRKSGRENRVLRTSNGGLLRNCSTLGYDRRFSGSNLYAHLMLIARIRQRYMIDGVRKFRGTRPAFNGWSKSVEERPLQEVRGLAPAGRVPLPLVAT